MGSERSWTAMTTETGRRASRLELIRARLHESAGRRCARDGDMTTRTSSAVRAAVDRDVRPSPLTGRRDTTHAAHNGIRPAVSRTADPDRRSGRDVTKPERKLQSGNTNHDRQVPVGRHAEVKGRSKLDVATDRQEYAQVRKPTDRGQTDVADTGHDDSTTSEPRRLAQKTSSSSSLLAKSQNFFARLRSRKNDPSKTSKSTLRDRGSGNDGASNTRIRRSISESGCALYANRELVVDNVNSVNMSPTSAHVCTEQQTVDHVARPEVVDGSAIADSANDHVTTTSVYAEVEPSTSGMSTDPDVVTQPTESTSGSGQADSCSMPTAVYEECAGSYSLREALLQRGAETVAPEISTSITSSHIARRPSSGQPDDNQLPLRTSSVLPVGGTVSGGCRSTSLSGWRRRKLAATLSSGCVVGGRRDGRLERIQEVDSPPGSAEYDAMSFVITEQRVGSDATQPDSDSRNCEFIAHRSACNLHLCAPVYMI